MTNATDEEIAEVAGKLTKAQIAALHRAIREHVSASMPTMRKLHEFDVIAGPQGWFPANGGFRAPLTILGLAVRAHLKRQQ